MDPKVFKNEDERLAAIEALPYEAPEGTEDIDVWLKDNDAELEAIATAKIDPELTADPVVDPNAVAPVISPVIDPAAVAPVVPPVEPSDIDKLTERLKKRDLDLQGMSSDYGVKLKEEAAARKLAEDKVAELKKKMEEAAANPPEPVINPEIQTIETEIAELSSQLDTTNPDDDPDYLKKLRKVQAKQYVLGQKQALQHKKDVEMYQKKVQATEENFKKLQEENEAKTEEATARANQKAALANMVKDVASLQKDNPELKGKDSYEKMYEDYNYFASNAAAEYYEKPIGEVTVADKDAAIKAYVDKNPYFLEKFSKTGVKEPASLRQYLLISNINALKQGYKQQDGKFVEYLDGNGKQVCFPSLKSAYEHYQTMNGMTGAKILAAQKEAVDGVKAAMAQRSDPLEIEVPSQSGRISNQETWEEAVKALDMKDGSGNLIFDDEKMGRLIQENPDNPLVKEYNKHLVALGQEAITSLA